jgi:Family of unknown function (DUF6159)
MFEKFARSWSLVKASAAVLQSNKELMVFPALSSLSTLIVSASFLIPAWTSGALQHMDRQHMSPGMAIFLFIFYLVQYFIIIFFNSALIGAALIRLRGGNPTVADGFRIAMSKLPAIFGYALISATVGLILRMLEERAGWLGSIVISLIGVAWSLATFLAVPILVNHDIGPVDAVKRSAELLKKTWGENLIGGGGIGVAFGLIIVLIVLVTIALAVATGVAHAPVLSAVVICVGIIAVLFAALIQAALQGIYAAAVYRYAEEGDVGADFDRNLVANAFRLKA